MDERADQLRLERMSCATFGCPVCPSPGGGVLTLVNVARAWEVLVRGLQSAREDVGIVPAGFGTRTTVQRNSFVDELLPRL